MASQIDIPYVNLAAQWEMEKKDLLPIIEEVMSSGWFIGGKHVDNFEEQAAQFCGVKHCVALNSGTDALVCGLIALGVGRGDEVITPPNSFIASTAAIAHIGAVPVFADVLADQNIDPSKVEEVITDRTKAIMPVHLTGRVARMAEINEIASRHNLGVIEDAAQSIGSKIDGVNSGAAGDVGCFSAHPLKNLNASGDAGFLVTDNSEIADRVRSMRNHGLVGRNIVEQFGYVSRMDALQAAILCYRLERLPEVIDRRRQNAMRYFDKLKVLDLQLPHEAENEFNTYHTFVIQLERRDELADFLKARGIETAIHYPVPIHLQPASKYLGHAKGDFVATEEQADRILTLPVHQYLDDAIIDQICSAISEFLVT